MSLKRVILTVLFAKIGATNVNSNLAAAVRTIVILIKARAIVLVRGEDRNIGNLSRHKLLFLVISGMAAVLSRRFYFKARQTGRVSGVAPFDKLSVILFIILSVIFFNEALTQKLAFRVALTISGTIVMVF